MQHRGWGPRRSYGTDVISEISLALERCRELGVPDQVTRVVASALNLAIRLQPDEGPGQ
jgi:hypothetical protein